ncbi:MauE/DoxX family redox-associated membrane protein [Mobilicoccus massiliensis]|uniref:MauE/DoxX family redox-associated membrane protein n=1 Tax=Mobilicoccus massiliensis TaxID=1522310 RepID=UPI0009E49045|nr:MauE/DoxX family redox-associated membrane protein [Mobilicoccus massiliensis]
MQPADVAQRREDEPGGGRVATDETPTGQSRGRVAGLWIGLLARLVLGGVLLVAGALKVGHPLAAARAAQAYEILPFEVAGVVGLALPVVEILLGALLVLGLFTRAAALGGMILQLVFIAAIASVWARGISIDCGCFGSGGAVAPEDTQYGWDIARDVGLALCGLWLVVRPHSRFALDSRISPERTPA